MTDKEQVKEYRKDEITVIWKQLKCIHSGVCVRKLPVVFNTAHRPWINVQGADAEAIMAAIDLCPSGALSYRIEEETADPPQAVDIQPKNKIQVVPNGPLLVNGIVEIVDQHGKSEQKTTMFALCRCGGSLKKPYCDGTHNFIGFKD
ncbi:MAG: (4Fe-4S)-binding protein [Bacteroidales bacterium]|nr:(4Fe-4S)-binding protein [Bacteroidales bacterium]